MRRDIYAWASGCQDSSSSARSARRSGSFVRARSSRSGASMGRLSAQLATGCAASACAFDDDYRRRGTSSSERYTSRHTDTPCGSRRSSCSILRRSCTSAPVGGIPQRGTPTRRLRARTTSLRHVLVEERRKAVARASASRVAGLARRDARVSASLALFADLATVPAATTSASATTSTSVIISAAAVTCRAARDQHRHEHHPPLVPHRARVA
jgi:hypothetical protein